MLKRNTSDSFPGADFVAADPVSVEDCCLHQSVASIITELRAEGIPFIMRGGRLYFDQGDDEQEIMCQGPAPEISGMDATDWEDNVTRLVTVDDKGVAEGEVWVGDAATWAGSVVKVEQTVDTWAGDDIEITTVQGVFELSPPAAYVYVINGCGRVSAVGSEIAWIEAP